MKKTSANCTWRSPASQLKQARTHNLISTSSGLYVPFLSKKFPPKSRKRSPSARSNPPSNHPSHFDFQDLTSSDPIQALRKSDSDWYDLLEVFNAELLDDYNDFLESHDDFLSNAGLDGSILHRKMRLLTLASLAASTPSRSLPYQHIARALQIPSEDVEMWVINVIRAGLVEGKLSQLNQTFLIHRSTYRVFGEKQWTEVQMRLDTWRTSLMGVLEVVRSERIKMAGERERELRELEGRVNGGGGGMGRGMGVGRGGPRDFDMGMD